MNNHYYRLDANGLVVFAFSDAFYTPKEGDFFVEEGERHFNPDIFNDRGQSLLRVTDGQPVERTVTELDAEWNALPAIPTIEDRTKANEDAINFLLGTVIL